MDEEYEPRIIMTDNEYAQYRLLLHRELATIAENRDPPSPFRPLLEEGYNLKIVVNHTNDLPWVIERFEEKIINGDYEHVIIGDPKTLGYSMDTLDRLLEDRDVSATYYKNKEWIIFLLNITKNNKLVIEQSKIIVER
jgi:hypothetical protein